MVVVRELVHRREKRRRLEARHIAAHREVKCLLVVVEVLSGRVAVLLHARQKPSDGLHKCIIVHHGVPLVALQPRRGVAVVLCQDQRVGIGRLHAPSELLPKLVVIRLASPEIGRHIQPPAVRAVGRGNPFAGDTHDVILQFRRLLVVELRKRIMPPPALVGVVARGIVSTRAPVCACAPVRTCAAHSDCVGLAARVMVGVGASAEGFAGAAGSVAAGCAGFSAGGLAVAAGCAGFSAGVRFRVVCKREERPVGALLRAVGAVLKAFGISVDALAVHPFVERSAVVENAVDNDAHAVLVRLRNQLCKELVTGLEVFAGGHAGNVLRGMRICRVALREADGRVLDDHAEMRIDVVVILNVILVARGRDENRV